MRPDNSRFIVEANEQRRDAALRRAYEAIDRLNEAGEPVNVRGRRRSRLGVEGMALSPATHPGRDRSPPRLLEDNKRLRDECRQLRDQVARLLGEQRMARIRPRP